MFFSDKILWRWGEVSPRAEGFCYEVYIRSALFSAIRQLAEAD